MKPVTAIYVETSALAKRYVAEARSDAFEQFVESQAQALTITPLAATELRSVLARLRLNELSPSYVNQAQAYFATDLQQAVWSVRPFPYTAFARAGNLLDDRALSLATLDALHLASALELSCEAFATADQQLARAAAANGLAVHSFS